ncbi:hypothetical protein [Actinoplanes sp. ATCC 53533]|uniref:hypothetical protein n=1 Tax=Actinoplanes sp. ATCC 53533 TaxID=1288362 RepID=UPI000F767280|nr:hypothetical protein [Actinoplanes sp. ATCC 53533]
MLDLSRCDPTLLRLVDVVAKDGKVTPLASLDSPAASRQPSGSRPHADEAPERNLGGAGIHGLRLPVRTIA